MSMIARSFFSYLFPSYDNVAIFIDVNYITGMIFDIPVFVFTPLGVQHSLWPIGGRSDGYV